LGNDKATAPNGIRRNGREKIRAEIGVKKGSIIDSRKVERPTQEKAVLNYGPWSQRVKKSLGIGKTKTILQEPGPRERERSWFPQASSTVQQLSVQGRKKRKTQEKTCKKSWAGEKQRPRVLRQIL